MRKRNVTQGRQSLDKNAWHRVAASGSLRAAVLGGNDGLVSNFALVWGVAGGTTDQQFVLLAGIAGLVAGAFSMAAGEYVSMRAHRDFSKHRIETERKKLAENPKGKQAELTLIYQLKGLSTEEANILAERIMQSEEATLDTLVREALGLDPSQLGSPWWAAVSSMVSFATGAVIPVFPYALGAADTAFLLSGALSATALLVVGAALSFFTGRQVIWGGIRMLLIGLLAACITFIIGNLIGISLS